MSFFFVNFGKMVDRSRGALKFFGSFSVAERRSCFCVDAAWKMERTVSISLLVVVFILFSLGGNDQFCLFFLGKTRDTNP